jgi:hypothetical protein
MKSLLKSWLRWTWKGLLLIFVSGLAIACILPILWLLSTLQEVYYAEGDINLQKYVFAVFSIVLATMALAIYARVFTRLYPEFLRGEDENEGSMGQPIESGTRTHPSGSKK